jgi:hypothetical protein
VIVTGASAVCERAASGRRSATAEAVVSVERRSVKVM